MSTVIDHRRINDLLAEALEGDKTPEQVCSGSPELLREVRERWEHCRGVQAVIDDLFPPAAPREGVEPAGPAFPVPTAPAAPLPEVPGYRVESVLGHGGMGVVYRAHHLRLNRAVAMKMLLSGAYAGRGERARFLREAESVAALQHPNVVQVFDVGEFEGRPYFTMELVEGGTLAQELDGTPLPAARAAGLARTLAEAVHAAHLRGIIHRDLKPANILLAPDGTPKITDFGLARHVDGDAGLTRGGAKVGTPSYMAPEQAAGTPGAAGPPADLYALGATLYETLTGRPPFRGETASDTERQVVAEDPVPPTRLNPKVPRDLATVCMKCLEKDRARRYPTAASLADDLGRFIRGEPILARPAGPVERCAKWVRRRPAPAAGLAAALLLATAGAAAGVRWVWQRETADRVVGAHLDQVADRRQAGDWAEARAALWRARSSADRHASGATRRKVWEVGRDLDLVERLAAIRSGRATATRPKFNTADVDREYQAALRDAGLGTVNEPAAAVAARVAASPARATVVAALDDWAFCFDDVARRRWLLDVARGADPHEWRDRVRNYDLWEDPAALGRLAADADLRRESVPLLLVLGGLLDFNGADAVPFHRRIQAAHPDDFWANFVLAELLDERDDPDAAGFYRAALAVQPRSAAATVNLATALSRRGLDAEAALHWERALELAPASSMVQHNVGVALFNEGKLEAAVERFRHAIDLAPEFPYAHAALGRALVLAGRAGDAEAPLRRALELLPATDPAREIVNQSLAAIAAPSVDSRGADDRQNPNGR